MNETSAKLVALSRRTPVVILAASLVGASLFAIFHSDAPAASETSSAALSAEPSSGVGDLPMAPAEMGSTLPPGHPSIGNSKIDPASAAIMNAPASAPSVKWTPPVAWKVLPNPSTMRLATYRIPRASGDTDDTDLSVVQAGGTADANIERWLGQFDGAGKDVRTTLMVHGMKVTIVEVKGAFMGGGMMADNTPSSHPGWALLAAIVESPDMPTFFKMVGPAKSVTASRPAFDALIASVSPVSQP